MNKIILLLLCVLLTNTFSFAQKESSITLKYQPKKGEVFKSKTLCDSEMDMLGIKIKIKSYIQSSMEVLEVDDKKIKLKSVIQHIKTTMGEGEEAQNYDSNKPDVDNAQDLVKEYKYMKNGWVVYTISTTGETLEVSEGSHQKIIDMFKNEELVFVIFPTKPLKIGKSWENTTFTKPVDEKLSYKNHNLLKFEENGQYIIEQKSNIEDKNGKKTGSKEGIIKIDKNNPFIYVAEIKILFNNLDIQGMKGNLKNICRYEVYQ